MEQDEIRQKHKSSDANKYESKLSASATVHFPQRIEEKCEGNDNTFNDNWIRPKKFTSTKCFETKSKIKKEHDDDVNESNMLIDANNNKSIALSREDEKEEEI